LNIVDAIHAATAPLIIGVVALYMRRNKMGRWAAQGIEARQRQDPKGLDPKDESPVTK
jgi:hypothetical protein